MNKIELNENSWNEDTVTKAQAVANIVDLGLNDGNYSKINNQLMELQDVESIREKYVFEHPQFAMLRIQIGICVAMSIVYTIFLIIAVTVCVMSDEFRLYAGLGGIVIMLVLLINILWYRQVHLKAGFYLRYEMYYKVLRFKNIALITDLAAFSKQTEKNVINDMQRAIQSKLIPQGHFAMDKEVFIVSNRAFEKYQAKKNTYDRYFKQMLDERRRMLERTDEMAKVMKKGEYYIEKIRESKNIIKDKSISQVLDKMEGLVQTIFYELDVYPQQLEKLGLFFNYYLPTTEKLLEAYIDVDAKQIKGKSLVKTKKEIERALGSINETFERTLDKFYQEKEIDIAAEISALEIMMKQEQ